MLREMTEESIYSCRETNGQKFNFVKDTKRKDVIIIWINERMCWFVRVSNSISDNLNR